MMTIDEALEIVVRRTGHHRYRALCDPADPAHNPAYLPLVMRLAGEPEPDISPNLAPEIPLAGDLVAALAQRLGADRLAKWVEKWAGRPCGCAERQAALNRLDATARRFLGWL
jgi:hypothetical protein